MTAHIKILLAKRTRWPSGHEAQPMSCEKQLHIITESAFSMQLSVNDKKVHILHILGIAKYALLKGVTADNPIPYAEPY